MPERKDTANQEQQRKPAPQGRSGSLPDTSGEIVVRTPEFQELKESSEISPGGSLGRLLGVKFEAEAVLGRTVLPVEEILKLGSGSVVPLDRMISEPVDLYVQGVKVAEGEVVVIGDKFAFRVKEIAKPASKS